MAVQIGKMDRRISLQVPTATVSAMGQETEAWTEVAEIWAQKVEESGRERIRNGRLEERQAALFTIRYRAVTGSMRIVDSDGIWEIMGSPREIGRRQFLEITTVRLE